MIEKAKRQSINVAVFVMLLRENKIFLLRRQNTGWADGMWTLPSGHIDQGQTAVEAAIIESKEEAMVTIEKEDIEFVFCHYVFDAYTNFYFKASKWEGEPTLGEPHLCSEVGWFDVDKIPEDTITHVKDLLRNYKVGNHFSDIPNDPNPS